jgi:hypothetical protein
MDGFPAEKDAPEIKMVFLSELDTYFMLIPMINVVGGLPLLGLHIRCLLYPLLYNNWDFVSIKIL